MRLSKWDQIQDQEEGARRVLDGVQEVLTSGVPEFNVDCELLGLICDVVIWARQNPTDFDKVYEVYRASLTPEQRREEDDQANRF